MKYRKKPVVVEAFVLGVDLEPDWFMVACYLQQVRRHYGYSGELVGADIETLEGTMYAKRGCYVVKGVDGEIYPCRADIFEQTYMLED